MIARTARDLGAEELLVESLPRFLNAKVVDDCATIWDRYAGYGSA